MPLQQHQAPAVMHIHGCRSEHAQMWFFVPSAALHDRGLFRKQKFLVYAALRIDEYILT